MIWDPQASFCVNQEKPTVRTFLASTLGELNRKTQQTKFTKDCSAKSVTVPTRECQLPIYLVDTTREVTTGHDGPTQSLT